MNILTATVYITTLLNISVGIYLNNLPAVMGWSGVLMTYFFYNKRRSQIDYLEKKLVEKEGEELE